MNKTSSSPVVTVAAPAVAAFNSILEGIAQKQAARQKRKMALAAAAEAAVQERVARMASKHAEPTPRAYAQETLAQRISREAREKRLAEKAEAERVARLRAEERAEALKPERVAARNLAMAVPGLRKKVRSIEQGLDPDLARMARQALAEVRSEWDALRGQAAVVRSIAPDGPSPMALALLDKWNQGGALPGGCQPEVRVKGEKPQKRTRKARQADKAARTATASTTTATAVRTARSRKATSKGRPSTRRDRESARRTNAANAALGRKARHDRVRGLRLLGGAAARAQAMVMAGVPVFVFGTTEERSVRGADGRLLMKENRFVTHEQEHVGVWFAPVAGDPGCAGAALAAKARKMQATR